jgi:hypothetical protein
LPNYRDAFALLACLLASLCLGCSSGTSSTGTVTPPTPTVVRPCDLFAPATPCVAAFSTTRALYGAYKGPLYQVTRQSDATTLDIQLLADGYANAAAQDAFCLNAKCTITEIYDQSSNHNNLTVAPPGGAATGKGPNGYDLPAAANALPIMAGGHHVYGISIVPGMGYRLDATTGVARNGEPEGVYMVTSTLELDGNCCFDFGNAEKNNRDNGASHMDAVNMGCPAPNGPPCNNRVGMDMENGVYGNLSVVAGTKFVTAMGATDGQNTYVVWQGDAQSGALTTTAKPLPAGYAPLNQEGAIILGIGGDNSDGDAGYFFEGVMTYGTPADAVMSSVQSNIVGATYTGL